MSTQTNTMTPPFQQWQSFVPPYAFDPSVYEGTTKVLGAINDSTRFLTADMTSLSKDVAQSSLGLRDAVERGNVANNVAIERIGGTVGSTVERNGGNIMTAIEKVAGEQRLTTTVTDAASRQAYADSARDLAIAIERNGANAVNASQNASGTLLASIERNAGENRVTTVTSQGFLDTKITDTRHSILNSMTNMGSEIHGEVVQSSNILSKSINDSAWETRTALSAGFSAGIVGQEKAKSDILKQGADYYASLLLEQQKLGQFLASKQDNQFAMTQIELLKSKSELAAQSAQQFSISQLEQQKLGALVSAQLAEAKYDALKNTQELSKQIAECCCSLKEKTDQMDHERLRDLANNASNDNGLLRAIEYLRGPPGYDYYGYGRGWHGHHGHGHGDDDRSRGGSR